MTDDNDTAGSPTITKARSYPALRVVGTVVDERIRTLQAGLRHPNPRRQALSMAVLARLRRGVGKPPGSVPDILAYTLADEFVGKQATDEPTQEEIAAHIAMTLYAVHQQSQKAPMHQRGQGLGRAIRRLDPDEPTIPPTPVVRRFQALVTSETLGELVHHARGIVQLLRAAKPAGFPVDYGQFADQLLIWQQDGSAKVRMAWARDFYRTRQSDVSSNADASPDPTVVVSSSSPEGN